MKKTLAILALGLTAIAGHAATPLWMRDVQISPDGTEIAFCYKGDIYKVPAKGGTATQLTTQESYECTPIWSPDGKQIAFASDRYGNFDVFVMPADGGTAQRLTTHSTGEIPSTFTPDGKYILFSASIQDPASSALFPTSAMTELYKVPATGGRTEQVLGTPAEAVCFDKAGHQFLYQDRKGFEDEWRKHHTSSITRDIWLYDAKTGIHTNLTDRAGEDRNPVLSPDGRTVYFLSERNGGSFNVYAFPLAQPREVKPITSFKTHPVRFLSMSDGGTLCYSYDGEIYTQQPDATPKKVAIELVRDDRPQFANLQSSDGATSAVVSPDGKQIAFTLRGEVFVTSADYATTKQVTHTPAREAGLSFATDNRTLAYASEISVLADASTIPADAVSVVIPDAVVYLPLEDLVDMEKEKERLTKEKERLTKELARSKGMLSNEKFLSRAPEAKVAEEKAKLEKYQQMMDDVNARLAQMK